MGGNVSIPSCNCKEMYSDFVHLKELNQKGIYTPDQIRKEVDIIWEQVVQGNVVANKEETKTIAMQTINKLGARGNGITFEEKEFR